MEIVLAALVTTCIPAFLSMKANRHAREARDIVRGNGHGDVTALSERIEAKLDDVLDWQGTHDARHRREAAARSI